MTMATQKGLGKITDFVRERFNGKKPDKYNEFIANFETGVLTLEIPIHKQCYLLMSLLEKTPNDVCSKFIATYKGLNPNVDSNNRQTRDAAQDARCAGTSPQHLSRGTPEPARAAGGPSGDPRWPGTPSACGFQEHSCPHSTPRF